MVIYMATQRIYAEQTVSITELRKNPSQFFKEEPVAVLSNNKPAGYMLSADLYEQMIKLLESNHQTSNAQFRPSRARLDEITQQGQALLLEASDKQLGTFHQ